MKPICLFTTQDVGPVIVATLIAFLFGVLLAKNK
jgi:hypothetical protein